MEDNRPNQDLTNQDIEFIKEKVKERPLNRRKLFKKTLLTASMAAIFGLIACVTFLVLCWNRYFPICCTRRRSRSRWS